MAVGQNRLTPSWGWEREPSVVVLKAWVGFLLGPLQVLTHTWTRWNNPVKGKHRWNIFNHAALYQPFGYGFETPNTLSRKMQKDWPLLLGLVFKNVFSFVFDLFPFVFFFFPGEFLFALPPLVDGRVCDLGAGTGRSAAAVAMAYPQAQLTLIDPDEDWLLNQLQRNVLVL